MPAALAIVLSVAFALALKIAAFVVSRLRSAKAALDVAAEARREADERWKSVVEVVGGVLIGVRPDLTIFEWNPQAESLYGLSRDQVIGQDYLRAAVPFDGRDEAANDLARAFKGIPLEGEERYVTDSRGRPRLLRWHERRITASSGELVGAILSGIDVTELHASGKRFSLLFELSSDAHVLFDAGGVIDCNQAALRLLGAIDKFRLAGVHPLELAPIFQPNGLQSSEAAFMAEAMARRQGHHRFDWTLQTLEGHPVPVEMTLTPVPFEGTEVMLAVWHDLSRRRAAEEAERIARVQMLEVIDAVDSGFAMYDAEERLVLCNKPYRAMLDLDTERLRTGAPLADILRAAIASRRGEHDDRDTSAFNEMLQKHRTPGPAFDVRLGDTTQRVTVQRTHDNGLVVTHTDITVIRQAHTELERAQHVTEHAREHADKSNRAKSAFLAGMSHELRTPLHTIIGFTRQLRRNAGGTMRNTELAYLDRVEWNGRHLLSIIDNLLDLSKIESGEIQANRAAFDLETCIRATVAPHAEEGDASKTAIRINVEGTLLPIESDASKLQQLVTHLLGDLASRSRTAGHGINVTLRGDESGHPLSLELCSAFTEHDIDTLSVGAAPTVRLDSVEDLGFDIVMARALCTLLGATLSLEPLDDGRRRLVVSFRETATRSKSSKTAHAA
ncbi:MAG: PAS domain S-box protein [Gemmatimonadaceae bacterium]